MRGKVIDIPKLVATVSTPYQCQTAAEVLNENLHNESSIPTTSSKNTENPTLDHVPISNKNLESRIFPAGELTSSLVFYRDTGIF